MEGRNKPVTRSSATVYPDDASIFHPNGQQDLPCLESWTDYLEVIGVLGVIVLAAAFLIILFMQLKFYPQDPEIGVDSYTASNFTFTNGSRVSFVAEIRLTVVNPSGKVSISYDQHMVAGIYYKSILLSQSSLAPFSQKPGNKTSLVVEVASHGNAVEKWAVDAMKADIGQSGRAEFTFALDSWATWDSKMETSRGFLKVLCERLTVAIPGDGRPGDLIDSPAYCRVVQLTDENSD